MTLDQWIVLAVFTVTVLLILSTRLRPDLVALMAALSLGLTGVIGQGEVLTGLSSSVVTTLIGLFIMARALEETGVLRWAAGRITELGSGPLRRHEDGGQDAEEARGGPEPDGGSGSRILTILMVTAASLSVGMNNLAVGTLFVPASQRVARRMRIPVSTLLLPVAYATLLGGMATYFTTANIVMSDFLVQQGARPLSMRDFLVTGGIVAVAGMLYLATVGRRLLPGTDASPEDFEHDYFGLYKLGERFWEMRVTSDSSLAGKTLAESEIGSRLGVSILAIRRRGRLFLVPGPGIAILPADELVALGREERIRELVEWGVEIRARSSPERFQHELELTEVVVGPHSPARGKTLSDLGIRTRYGVNVLALWREGRVIRTDVGRTPLQVGDALLVVNLPHRLDRLAATGDFLVVGARVAAPSRPHRAPVAVGLFAGVLAVAFTGLLPIGQIALTGGVAMILAGCVSLEDAYRSIEWNVLFLIAGLLPLGFAMVDTGLAAEAAALLGGWATGSDPLLVVALMFVLTAAVTQVIGGQVSPLLVGPVALSVATSAGIALPAMAVAVAIGASTAFLAPTGHPVNALVMGSGGYRPRDFLRAGAGLSLVVLATLLGVLWLVWGIR
ncbi:MAG: SLC13 family permease [Longimicrobiales bacterium]|nr:SLC13 family permease [Longimicrobiales bacterium]